MQSKNRIDVFLAKNNYCKTRSQAQEMINFGLVKVNNKIVEKYNFIVKDNDLLIVEKLKYVSRAGLKLDHAIKSFDIDLKDKVILDIGASTGGFTDCCLQNDAKFVYSLDVGTNQLHTKLKNNPRILSLENTNLKNIPKIDFKDNIDCIVCDVSFISLNYVFNSIKKLLNENLIMIFLIKPEFELDKKIIKQTKGLVTNKKHHDQAIKNVVNYANNHNIKLIKIIESPIKGRKMGNIEFLALFKWKK